MGAEDYDVTVSGSSAQDAFYKAVEDALYEHGHGGYTGTIAEKHDMRELQVPEGKGIEEFVSDVTDADDKWGPANCLDLGNGQYRFFGLASS